MNLKLATVCGTATLLLAACAGRPSPSASVDVAPSATPRATAATVGPSAPISAPPSPTQDLPATTPPGTTVWTLLDVEAGPAAREAHTWTTDRAGATAYLFGGRAEGAAMGDLWAFDLATDTWTEVVPSGTPPPARFGHNAAWVDDIGLVVFAGQAGSTFYNDLWAYDPEANEWSELPGEGDAPVARYGSCAALGPDGRLWISHGFTQDGVRFSDTRAYDFESGAWEVVAPGGTVPVERCLHGCWWTPDGRFALYAGQTTDVTALGDLWALTPDDGGWEEVGGQLPAERNLYAFAQWGEEVIVFGGLGADGIYRSDLARFDDLLVAFPVDVPGVIPPARQGAQMVADEERGRILLFGGLNESGALGDLWSLTPPGT